MWLTEIKFTMCWFLHVGSNDCVIVVLPSPLLLQLYQDHHDHYSWISTIIIITVASAPSLSLQLHQHHHYHYSCIRIIMIITAASHHHYHYSYNSIIIIITPVSTSSLSLCPSLQQNNFNILYNFENVLISLWWLKQTFMFCPM